MIKQGLKREGGSAKTLQLKVHKAPQCDTDIYVTPILDLLECLHLSLLDNNGSSKTGKNKESVY